MLFPLKRDASNAMRGNMNLPLNSLVGCYSIDEPRRSKIHRVETSFAPNFITIFSIKNFNIDAFTNE